MSDVVVLLPLAVGLAFSPVPIIEMVLVLFSTRRAVNSIVFVVSLVATSAVGLALGVAGSNAAGDSAAGSSKTASVILALLGVLLLSIGVRNLRNRADHSEPAVLARIRDMGPAAVAVLALGATLLNPKNLPLLLAAGSALASTSTPVVTGVLFLVVCTSPYWASALYAGVGGPTAQTRLNAMRIWLIRRNRLVMGVLCMGLGLVIVAKAAVALGG